MPLSDIRVIDLSRFLPGPAAAALLADFGADVVRVVQPDAVAARDRAQGIAAAGPERARQRAAEFAARNKRSVMLDFRSEEGRDAILRMAASADVLVHDFRRSTIEKAGLGWDRLQAVNPRLICLAVSATGQTGPRADMPGHDPIALSLAGVMSRVAEQPHMLGFPAADMLTAAHSAFAVMVALRAREATGRGALIDAAMADSALALMTSVFTRLQRDGREPPLGFPLGDSDVFETSDGGYVAATNMEPAFWERFCKVAERPDLVARFADKQDRAGLEAEVAAIYRGRSRAEWDRLARDNDLQIAPVHDAAEALAEPHFHARGTLVRTGDGNVLPGRFIRIEGIAPRQPRPGREPGADTAEVLAEYGFADAEIAALGGFARPARREGAVR